MVDLIGAGLPPSVQAVKNAQNSVKSQSVEVSDVVNPADQVTLSAQAQELSEIDRLASETRQILLDDDSQTLGGATGAFETFL